MPDIALVMIARDEARCIERALRSAAAWVDEMHVLDTGSVDDTPDIARRCGASVAHARWQDDFAAARNAALAYSDAHWRLVMDADEWLADGAESLAAWRADAAPRIGLLRVTSLLDGGPGGTQQSPSWLPRLLPRGVAYRGRIHEQPHSALPRQRVGLQLLHDGYLPAQRAGKAGRNRRLLQAALQADPDDAYLHYQLGKDFEVHGLYAEAEPRYARARRGADAQAAWRHDLVLRSLFTLKKLQLHAQALALAETEAPHWSHSPDFHFTLGDLLLDCAAAQPQLAGALLPRIEAAWRRALHIGDNPALPDTVLGRGSFLAAYNLALLCDAVGDAEQALAWREKAAGMRAEGRAAAPR